MLPANNHSALRGARVGDGIRWLVNGEDEPATTPKEIVRVEHTYTKSRPGVPEVTLETRGPRGGEYWVAEGDTDLVLRRPGAWGRRRLGNAHIVLRYEILPGYYADDGEAEEAEADSDTTTDTENEFMDMRPATERHMADIRRDMLAASYQAGADE